MSGAMLSGPVAEPIDGEAERLVVLLHGVGASGADLMPLVPDLAARLPNAVFHAPDAPYPCDFAPFGRQWFSLSDRTPAVLLAGLERVRPTLETYVEGLRKRYDVPAARTALLGFSQGCMTALHLGPRMASPPAAIVGASGALCGPVDPARKHPPVLLIHGETDEVVPAAAMPAAASALRGAGFSVETLLRPGLGHAIDAVGIEAAGHFLAEKL